MEQLIFEYFPGLSALQKEQVAKLYPLYSGWNSRINVISRKDIGSLYLHHVLHSLAIAEYICFPAESRIADVGTGGGFPGIPLAILFPEVEFTLCDSIGKKIKVVQSVAEELGLKNITSVNSRAEQLSGKFDYVVSRAVTDLSNFLPWIWNKITPGENHGVIYLKGGTELLQEIARAAGIMKIKPEKISVKDITDYFPIDFFDEKKILHIRK